ncbi:MAG: DNA repair protein RadC [Clostridia bacterium]|nr:DNA repair protein RadC [Clostridia bacterium]
MKMKELPISERPYEKLEMYGESTLSNAELLAIIIKNGTKEESSVMLAQKILSLRKNQNCKEDNLRFLQEISINELMSIHGIGKVKAIQLKAVCELAKRISRPIDLLKRKITCPKDVANLFMDELKVEKREIVKVVILDSQNCILKVQTISLGGTISAQIEPKDILTEAIKIGAPKMILLHNHPSGDATPSRADMQFTKRLEEASVILGVQLLDHITIGDGNYRSMKAMMVLQNQERNETK